MSCLHIVSVWKTASVSSPRTPTRFTAQVGLVNHSYHTGGCHTVVALKLQRSLDVTWCRLLDHKLHGDGSNISVTCRDRDVVWYTRWGNIGRHDLANRAVLAACFSKDEEEETDLSARGSFSRPTSLAVRSNQRCWSGSLPDG